MRSRYAGGFPGPRGAGTDDGLCRGVLLPDPGRAWRRVRVVADLKAGRLPGAGIQVLEGRRFRLSAERPMAVSVDGEYRRRRDPSFRVLPGALLVAAP